MNIGHNSLTGISMVQVTMPPSTALCLQKVYGPKMHPLLILMHAESQWMCIAQPCEDPFPLQQPNP